MSDPTLPPPPGAGGSAAAAQQVKGPAIGLFCTAGIGALLNLVSIGMNAMGAGLSGMGNLPGGSEQEQVAKYVSMMSGGLGIVFAIIGIAMAVVVFLGAQKMMQLSSWTFALVVSILAMIPCISPCCIIGLPIGIWALVVLNRPEVKGAFTG